MKYLIWSFEHNAWWRPNECGYTENIDEAGRYEPEDAKRIVANSILCEEIAILESVAVELGSPYHWPYCHKRK